MQKNKPQGVFIMANLGCTAKNCVHNDQKLCCLKEIEVSGKGALNSDMTCCSSFCGQKGAVSNALHKEPERATGIKCDVENCSYNHHHYCTADTVDITGAHACNCGQTECSTFRPR